MDLLSRCSASTTTTTSNSNSSGFLTLFGDGYSWVDNTDYVVIA